MIALGINVSDINQWIGIASAIEAFKAKSYIDETGKKNNGRSTVTRWFQGNGLIVRIRDKKQYYYLPQVESWEPPKKGNPDHLGQDVVPDSTRSEISAITAEIRLSNQEAICQVVPWKKWFALEVQYIEKGKLQKPKYIALSK